MKPTCFFFFVADAIFVLVSAVTLKEKRSYVSLRGQGVRDQRVPRVEQHQFKLSNLHNTTGARWSRQGTASWPFPPPHEEQIERQNPNGPRCGDVSFAHAESPTGKTCPAECPLYAQYHQDEEHCAFRCVPATVSSCQILTDGEAPVPDTELGICRECMVNGCHQCSPDGTDTCLECKNGFLLTDKGHCFDKKKYVLGGLFVLVSVVIIFLIAWISSLKNRPITNPDGLQRGLDTRSASKMLQPRRAAGEAREFWPIDTNLMKEPVAGNGVLLMFNFQFAIIVWAIVVLVAWVVMAYAVDEDFLRVGTRDVGSTPRNTCIIIAWGFLTQERLMKYKYVFVFGVYIFSFLAAIIYAIFQYRRSERLDAKRISHKDYCAVLLGLPPISGRDRPEEELQKVIEEATGERVIGVSVAWDMFSVGKEDLLLTIINQDMETRIEDDLARNPSPRPDFDLKYIERGATETELERKRSMNCFDRLCDKWEAFLLNPRTQKIIRKQHYAEPTVSHALRKANEAEDDEIEVDVVEELEKLNSTDNAYVIFETEAARDRAVAAVHAAGGLDFRQTKVQTRGAKSEPQAIHWNKLTIRSYGEKLFRIWVGILVIIIALAIWSFCFYQPYAHAVIHTDYGHGRDPSPMAKTMFGFVVVAGNAIMYLVCAEVSDRIGFKTRGKREVCYMLTYCMAVGISVLFDLEMSYYQTWNIGVGKGVRTHDGVKLEELDSFSGRFETYAMQKALGQVVYDYAFPATYLYPFLVEPIVTILAPYLIMSLIVRTKRSLGGPAADAYLVGPTMDLSRYADVLFNVMLAVLLFFFPGGFTLPIMCALILCHIWIYVFDHCRVLRSIAAVDIGTSEVDKWAQWLLSIPLGMLLACAAFKSNCHKDVVHCIQDHSLVKICFALMLGHIVVHSFILFWIVPLFGYEEPGTEVSYEECATSIPCSWFAANPVHCLRSKYLFEHDPPCDYYILGKEYMLRENKKLNLFYTAPPPRREEYRADRLYEATMEHVKSSGHHLRSNFRDMSMGGLFSPSADSPSADSPSAESPSAESPSGASPS